MFRSGSGVPAAFLVLGNEDVFPGIPRSGRPVVAPSGAVVEEHRAVNVRQKNTRRTADAQLGHSMGVPLFAKQQVDSCAVGWGFQGCC